MSGQAEQASFFDPRPLAVRFAEWEASALGRDVLHQVERIVTDQVAAGERRVSVGRIWESLRAARHVKLNNDFRAMVSRWLVDRHPEWRERIYMRKQRAA